MIEIRAQDLRFTEDEAVLFLNRTMGLHLTPAQIAAPERRTEGWAAGLQLALLALQATLAPQPAPSITDVAAVEGFIAAFAGDDRYVADYLVAEVLEGQLRDGCIHLRRKHLRV